MEVWSQGKDYGQHFCWFDEKDLEKVRSLDVMWNAAPAKSGVVKDGERAGARKFYVLAKRYRGAGKGLAGKGLETVMFHRFVLGLADPDVEGHHVDNDGLNNRRGNLEAVSHKRNMRESVPGRDWELVDARIEAAEEYRQERKIAARVAKKFGISRQGMFKIRRGVTKGSSAALAYFDECKEARVRPLWDQRESEVWSSGSGVSRNGVSPQASVLASGPKVA